MHQGQNEYICFISFSSNYSCDQMGCNCPFECCWDSEYVSKHIFGILASPQGHYSLRL